MAQRSSNTAVTTDGLAKGLSPSTASSSLAAAAAAVQPLSQAARTGVSLPREILAWLQSLQLNNSVTYPRRDLANGYVIAHICARYWPHVPLHSFENKVSTASKESNWFVLRKVLRQHGVEVSASMVEGMMKGSEGCAAAFLLQLHTVLTGKALDVEAVPLEESLPAVATGDVPTFVPNTTGGAGARARFATGSSTGVAPSIQFDLRSSGTNRADMASPSFAPAANPGSRVGGADPSHLRRHSGFGSSTASMPLPPITPIQSIPAELGYPATTAAAALAAGKPVLNVSVRTAGQVTTVLSAQAKSLTNAAAVAAVAAAAGDTREACPPDHQSSLAAAWFGAKVQEALPPDAVEAVMAGITGATAADNTAATAPTTAAAILKAVLQWLHPPPPPVETEFDRHAQTNAEPTGESRETRQDQLRTRAWQAAHNGVPELAQLLVQHSGHGLDVLVDGLFEAVVRAQAGAYRDTPTGAPSGIVFVRHALRFCALLLATLSDLNVHHAAACFEVYFTASSPFARAVRGLQWSVARDYAELITAVLPVSRRLAGSLLNSLWSSLESVVHDVAAEDDAETHAGNTVDSATEEGKTNHSATEATEVSLLVLLRALVMVLLPLINSLSPRAPTVGSAAIGGAHAQGDGSGRNTPCSARRLLLRSSRSTSGNAIAQDAVNNAVLQLALQRCCAALQHAAERHESVAATADPTLLTEREEAATALAVDLLRVDLHSPLITACLVGASFFDIHDALFPFSESTDTPEGSEAAPPTLSVLRARWLGWCLHRRWELGLSYTPAASVAALQFASSAHAQQQQQQQRVSHASFTATPRDVGEQPGVRESRMESHEQCALLAGVRTLCRELSAPPPMSMGETDKQARLLVAHALTRMIPFLPTRYRSVPADTTKEAEKLQQRSADIFAEDVAETALQVFVQEASPAQMRALLGIQTPPGAAPATREADTNDVWQTSSWIARPYVGSLAPLGSLVAESDLLLLVKSVLNVLEGRCGGGKDGEASGANNGSVVTASVTGGAVGNGLVRRLGARAAVVARDGRVDDKIAKRFRWLSLLLVEGRSSTTAFPLLSRQRPLDSARHRTVSNVREDAGAVVAQVSEGDAPQWMAILIRCFEDIVTVIQAASLRFRQRGGAGAGGPAANSGAGNQAAGESMSAINAAASAQLVDTVGQELLKVAQQAERILCCLWRELASVLQIPANSRAETDRRNTSSASPASMPNSNALGSTIYSFVDGVSPEEVATAMTWMCAVTGAA